MFKKAVDPLVIVVMLFAASSGFGQREKNQNSNNIADLVLLNGNIITVDSKNSIAQAVAVKDDRILAVGTNSQINYLVGPQTKTIDLKGKCVTPGIVDSHIHVLYYGKQFWKDFLNIRYPTVKNEKDLLKAIADKAKSIPKGEWISANQGFHVDPNEKLDRWVLDSVAPDNPVYLRHASGQYVVVNSAALKLAGIDKNTPNPYSSKIVRDNTGEPTGVLLHYPAENLVGKLAPGYGNRSEEELLNDLKVGQDICLSAGITSGQDVIVSNPRDAKIYKDLADKGELKMRIYLLLYVNDEKQARQFVKQIKGYKSDMLTFGGWKLAIDGGDAPGTQLMYDNMLPASKNSYYYFTPDELKRIVQILHDSGLQVAFHIGGDKGIDEALDAIELANKTNPRNDTRYRIEHAIFVRPESLERIKKLDVVISTSPQWISWHGDMFLKATNEKNMANLMPIGSMLRMGIPLAFGCDVPASIAHEPEWALVGAVLRKTHTGYQPNPNERIDIREALRIHTMGSAYAAFEEDQKGSIEPGKFADLVVWSDDLYKLKPQQIDEFRPLMTFVGGKIVYEEKT
ncbi:MAG: amidohydrolase, partial [Methanotrichaceae archaeon]|nr:amidohydrolase [Methanotrichaceae archaeon]